MPPEAHVLRLLRRVASLGWARLAVWCALSLAAAWPALSTAGSLVDYRDAQYFTLFEDTARQSVVRFHEFPLWNPYYCGGIDALGTPSARFASPTFLLTILFGTLRADALVAFVMAVVGLEGAWRVARSYGASPLGAMLAAPSFALCGFFARSAQLAWTNFWGFELLPWAVLGTRFAVRGSVRGAVVAALAVGWMIGFGGTYAAPMTALVCAFEVGSKLAVVARNRQGVHAAARIAGMAAIVAVLALGVSALRTWAIADTLSSSPRLLGGADGHKPEELGHYLFDWRGAFVVGVLAIPVAALGALRKRTVAPIVGGVLWLWLAGGYLMEPSLFALLRTVPPYTMLRAPERFLVPFALMFAVGVALGVRRLEGWSRKRRLGALLVFAGVGLLGASAWTLVLNDHAITRARKLMPPPTVVEREFAQARGDRWLAAYYPPLSRGTLSCFDDYQVQQSGALRGDLAAEEFAKDSAGRVERRAWSPGRIALHIELDRPGRVVVNQNWHPGWRASEGEVVSDEGRLAVDLPAGAHDVVLRFLPRHAVGGAAATIVALVVAWLLWRRARARDRIAGSREWRRTFAMALSPALAIAAAWALVPEPRRPPPALVGPGGDEIVADAPPEDARRIGARFDDGVTLEAVRLRPTTAATLELELDWRLEHAAPRGLGVFVHIEASGVDTVNVDHVAIAGVAPLETLPAGRTLRDVSPTLTLPTTDRKTYKVYVGLWRARREGGRVHVIDAGTATATEDRVLVATFDAP